jgi:hypothetical protein
MSDKQRVFVLNELVGETILLQYVGAPVPDPEKINQMMEDPNIMVTASTRVVSQFVRLQAYDRVGIVVEDLSKDSGQFFVSWGVISRVQGVDLEDPASSEG